MDAGIAAITELAVEAKLPHRKRESGHPAKPLQCPSKGLGPRSHIGKNSGGVMHVLR